VGTALGQVGKPYAFGTDGPDTFSCTGLVRFALRSVGINDAPWDHYAYLSAYPNVASPEPGDVVVYPDGAAMYVGDGTVVMANHADGVVGTYPMNSIGTPVGFARPYGGAADPAPVDQTIPADQTMASDPAPVDQTMPVDQMAIDPLPVDQMAIDPLPVDQTMPVDQMAIDPLPIDPLPVDPLPVDPMMPPA